MGYAWRPSATRDSDCNDTDASARSAAARADQAAGPDLITEHAVAEIQRRIAVRCTAELRRVRRLNGLGERDDDRQSDVAEVRRIRKRARLGLRAALAMRLAKLGVVGIA